MFIRAEFSGRTGFNSSTDRSTALHVGLVWLGIGLRILSVGQTTSPVGRPEKT